MRSQVDWIKVNSDKACLIDNSSNILFQPQLNLDILHYPSNELCQVKKDGKYGYINLSGKLVIPFKYKRAYPFSDNGLAFVVNDNNIGGYIDQYGEFIIPPIYETGSNFKFGFAAVSKNGKYEYIYKNGMKAVNKTFKYASGFSETGLAKVETFNEKQSLMDTRSHVVIELKEGSELSEFKEDSRITKFKINNREALINAAGDIITGFFEHVFISPYSRLNPFLRNGLWGYVDQLGNEVIPNIYKQVTQFDQNDIARVKSFNPLAENQICEFYINEKDEILDNQIMEAKNKIFKEKFSHINGFKRALALAIKR